jgi:hypothetical protein
VKAGLITLGYLIGIDLVERAVLAGCGVASRPLSLCSPIEAPDLVHLGDGRAAGSRRPRFPSWSKPVDHARLVDD